MALGHTTLQMVQAYLALAQAVLDASEGVAGGELEAVDRRLNGIGPLTSVAISQLLLPIDIREHR